MASNTAGAQQTAPGPRQQILDAMDREHATTVRVLRAYPPDKLDLQPHPRCKSARELAWVFAGEAALAIQALTTGIDWTAQRPSAPATVDELVAGVEEAHRRFRGVVAELDDARFAGTVQFPVAPRKVGDVPVAQFLWMMLLDQIHHRGQFSIYLRMADGKVPSIYGPSADEPWM